jgi:hypothetical protein
MRSLRLPLLLLLIALILAAVLGGLFIYRGNGSSLSRTNRVIAWIRNPASHPEWVIQAGGRCGSAPFIFPTQGFPGFLWDDSFRIGHRHQGIDIFSGTDAGVTPVISAHPGYLSRLPDWKSTVIIRIPDDPLHPGRQIWTYYTHMADSQGNSFISPEFPPGASEVYVETGALLGYQGNYSGEPGNPVGVHLHFSIVLDDGQGRFLNELEIGNTLDPSPYLGLPLNANSNGGEIPVCSEVDG